jgi:S1-C subfamily serine protease
VRGAGWWRRRAGAPLAVLLCTSALLGGGVSAGILAATRTFGGGAGSTTTIVRTASSGGSAASASGTGLDAQSLYASASPGVVDITAKGVSSGADSAASPFGAPQQQQESTATGTGFVVDRQDHVVTAAHVVDGAFSVSVKFADGTTRTARVLGQDDATDVAVLAVDASGLTLHPLALGSSSSLDVGDEVAAIGDPFATSAA